MDRTPSQEPSRARAAPRGRVVHLAVALLTIALAPDAAAAAFEDGSTDPLARGAALATWAAAAGALIGTASALALRERRAAHAAFATAIPALLLGWAAVGGSWGPLGAVPDPVRGAAALAGLALVGLAFAPGVRGRGDADPRPTATVVAVGMSRAGALLLLAIVADGAAAGWGLVEPVPPWSPETAARLLDLSPRAFVLESAGVDWMRHESVYDVVGTDRLGPGIRAGWGGSVAAYLVLVGGWAAAVLRRGVRTR